MAIGTGQVVYEVVLMGILTDFLKSFEISPGKRNEKASLNDFRLAFLLLACVFTG
jgi:hypothetical protein